MKIFAVPTLIAGSVAALSILFFTGLSSVLGDEQLGQMLLAQSAIALVSIFCIPQCFVYLIAAHSEDELLSRYKKSLVIEVLGSIFGLVCILLFFALPLESMGKWRAPCLVIYMSLSLQAMSSSVGWFRAKESWLAYAAWNLTPNLIRIPLIWATPWALEAGLLPDARGNYELAFFLYYLVPDLIRLFFVQLPLIIRQWSWPGLTTAAEAAQEIFKNWFFDVGSAINDVADKIVVGALLGPKILVTYYFARKLGVMVVMVCEPYNWERFRRISAIDDPLKKLRAQKSTHLFGVGIALSMFLSIFVITLILKDEKLAEYFLPSSVHIYFQFFAAVLLCECLISSNKWGRYISNIGNYSLEYLCIRLILFALFAAICGTLMGHLGVYAVVAALAISWLLETVYLVGKINKSVVSR